MQNGTRFLSVDLGASSGRVMAAHWDGRHFELEELHRFANGGVRAGDRLFWDVLRIWSEMLAGFARFKARYGESPASVFDRFLESFGDCWARRKLCTALEEYISSGYVRSVRTNLEDCC